MKTLIVLLLFVAATSFAQEAATSTPSVMPKVPDALQNAMTKVPTSYSLDSIDIHYERKEITVFVNVYDQNTKFLASQSITLGPASFDLLIDATFIGKVQQEAFKAISR
jgi:hypothetical protein